MLSRKLSVFSQVWQDFCYDAIFAFFVIVEDSGLAAVCILHLGFH